METHDKLPTPLSWPKVGGRSRSAVFPRIRLQSSLGTRGPIDRAKSPGLPSDWRSEPIRPHSIDPARKRVVIHFVSPRQKQSGGCLRHSKQEGVPKMHEYRKKIAHGSLRTGMIDA